MVKNVSDVSCQYFHLFCWVLWNFNMCLIVRLEYMMLNLGVWTLGCVCLWFVSLSYCLWIKFVSFLCHKLCEFCLWKWRVKYVYEYVIILGLIFLHDSHDMAEIKSLENCHDMRVIGHMLALNIMIDFRYIWLLSC
jgi:hypothetical protein